MAPALLIALLTRPGPVREPELAIAPPSRTVAGPVRTMLPALLKGEVTVRLPTPATPTLRWPWLMKIESIVALEVWMTPAGRLVSVPAPPTEAFALSVIVPALSRRTDGPSSTRERPAVEGARVIAPVLALGPVLVRR